MTFEQELESILPASEQKLPSFWLVANQVFSFNDSEHISGPGGGGGGREGGAVHFVYDLSHLFLGQNPCISLPCKNGGSCSPGEISYQCFCNNGYTGQNCTERKIIMAIVIFTND